MAKTQIYFSSLSISSFKNCPGSKCFFFLSKKIRLKISIVHYYSQMKQTKHFDLILILYFEDTKIMHTFVQIITKIHYKIFLKAHLPFFSYSLSLFFLLYAFFLKFNIHLCTLKKKKTNEKENKRNFHLF